MTSVDGTTRLLMAQTGAVIDAVEAAGRPVALLGHSMATDILARVAAERDDHVGLRARSLPVEPDQLAERGLRVGRVTAVAGWSGMTGGAFMPS